MKYVSQETVDYMADVWGFSSSTESDDMAMFWEMAEYEMVAKRLVDAGAVVPNCKAAKQMISVAKSITRKEEQAIIDEVVPQFTVVECTNCNHLHYVSQWSDVANYTGPRATCDGCAEMGHMAVERKIVK